jgi:hypothetical protein
VRQTRRNLDSISPETSHPQKQSPLFSILPSEIRNLIFKHVVCQQYDRSRPELVPDPAGHDFKTDISTELLRTCRLVYYETKYIPTMSATHHFKDSAPIWRGQKDCYLFHLPRQISSHLYHVHFCITYLPADLTWPMKLFKNQCLAWKKVTFTLRMSWRPPLMLHQLRSGETWLSLLTMPSSCEEVIVELELIADVPLSTFSHLPHKRIGPKTTNPLLSFIRGLVANYGATSLNRFDGTRMYPVKATSEGFFRSGKTWYAAFPGLDDSIYYVDTVMPVQYQVMRSCWRGDTSVSMRKYTRYDYLCCLGY